MILLDTHVWWWSLSEPEKLSQKAIELIRKTPPAERSIASISIWELAMMVSRGKIETEAAFDQWLTYSVDKTRLHVFELSPGIAMESCRLPGDFHKDPADRIIVATARVNNLILITKDEQILKYRYVKSEW